MPSHGSALRHSSIHHSATSQWSRQVNDPRPIFFPCRSKSYFLAGSMCIVKPCLCKIFVSFNWVVKYYNISCFGCTVSWQFLSCDHEHVRDCQTNVITKLETKEREYGHRGVLFVGWIMFWSFNYTFLCHKCHNLTFANYLKLSRHNCIVIVGLRKANVLRPLRCNADPVNCICSESKCKGRQSANYILQTMLPSWG